MYLEWWMIWSMAAVWVLSLIGYGTSSRRDGIINGAGRVLTDLDEKGYIQIKKDGGIIGLCNKEDEEN